MSVFRFTTEWSPIPTEPVILADAVLRRALQNPVADRAFAKVCRTITDNFGPKLLHAIAKAKHDRKPATFYIDPETRQAIADFIVDWCIEWAGWSMHILGLAATETMARLRVRAT